MYTHLYLCVATCVLIVLARESLLTKNNPGNHGLLYTHAREPLYSNSAVIAGWLQSTRTQNCIHGNIYIYCKKAIFCQYFTSGNILNCTLMWKQFEIRGRSILKVIQAFHTVRIVLYTGALAQWSGPRLHTFWFYLDPRLLGQNTRYTELCVQHEKLE